NYSKEAFEDWARHDDAQDHFCELDDETSPDADYVDLLLNPERYTGYKGPSAWRVWNSIYEENCFKSVYRPLNPLVPPRGGDDDGEGFYNWLEGLCLEKRVFYRLISGLHSSINIHLCAEYLLGVVPIFHPNVVITLCQRRCNPDSSLPLLSSEGWGKSLWGPNVQEFRQRFDPAETKGEGTRRLKNLYFLYLIELRALSKVAPYFDRAFVNLYTGDLQEDRATKEAFPMHFDEKSMFAGQKIEAKTLKEEFRLHFKNISRIMDCVGCSKCRLWGKLQVRHFVPLVLCLLWTRLCLEKRVFYRLISGLHSSINIHLCAGYLLGEGWGKSLWGPNVQEFRQRFDPAETKGEGTRRLKNLYFLYLIELRALSKVAPYFDRAFVNLAFPMHFDEKSMFAGQKIEAKTLKEEFRLHFKNISRIMDCVGCSKCRLWGKLQTQGLGTALKILFSEKEIKNLPEHSPSKGFQLTRQDIVALLNGFG
ncbi:unnamed protein product, partial [Coregonus sp. 'balchen']